MSKKKDATPSDAGDGGARLVTSDADKAKAAKWFERARELGDKRQFDYAVEYYVNGLEFWPDAVEEACKPLHGCAIARRQTGGKKPGLRDTMTRSVNDKDARQAFLNSMWLFGHDPDSLSYLEGIVRSANRLRADDSARWGASIWLKAMEALPKVSGKQFQALIDLIDELGDRAAARNDGATSVAAFQLGVEAVNVWRRKVSGDNNAEVALKNLSTKLTIQKGKYSGGESFRDSMADREGQRELHDKQRTVQTDQRVDELVVQAEQELAQKPGDGNALKHLIDMLCRREQYDEETKAIGLLVAEYKRTSEYRWKQLADDIRMKQLNRRERELKAAGDEQALHQHQINLLRTELQVFKERLERYPTDLRLRFEYAVRNFRAGRYDEAIPLFQAARTDPKSRTACAMYLGRCFYRKKYPAQAIQILQEGLSQHEFADDDLAKEMMYWLGRSEESGGDAEAARNTYGRLLQLDYNYRDVRTRMDALPS